MLKDDVRIILNVFGEMTPDHLLSNEINLLAESKFKLAYKKKTDFIKIISAMYDLRMFETKDGFIASSKQDIMTEFGRILDEDFSAYSTYLSMAKKSRKRCFHETLQ